MKAVLHGKPRSVILLCIAVSIVLTAMYWHETVAAAQLKQIQVDFPAVLARNLATGW